MSEAQQQTAKPLTAAQQAVIDSINAQQAAAAEAQAESARIAAYEAAHTAARQQVDAQREADAAMASENMVQQQAEETAAATTVKAVTAKQLQAKVEANRAALEGVQQAAKAAADKAAKAAADKAVTDAAQIIKQQTDDLNYQLKLQNTIVNTGIKQQTAAISSGRSDFDVYTEQYNKAVSDMNANLADVQDIINNPDAYDFSSVEGGRAGWFTQLKATEENLAKIKNDYAINAENYNKSMTAAETNLAKLNKSKINIESSIIPTTGPEYLVHPAETVFNPVTKKWTTRDIITVTYVTPDGVQHDKNFTTTSMATDFIADLNKQALDKIKALTDNGVLGKTFGTVKVGDVSSTSSGEPVSYTLTKPFKDLTAKDKQQLVDAGFVVTVPTPTPTTTPKVDLSIGGVGLYGRVEAAVGASEQVFVSVTNALSNAAKEIQKGVVEKNGINALGAAIAYAGTQAAIGAFGAATLPFRPLQVAGIANLAISEDARTAFVKYIADNPFDFVMQTGGGLLGGYLVGKALTPITEPIPAAMAEIWNKLGPKIPGVNNIYYARKFASNADFPEFNVGELSAADSASVLKGAVNFYKQGISESIVMAKYGTNVGEGSAFVGAAKFLGQATLNDLTAFVKSVGGTITVGSEGNIIIGGIKFLKQSGATTEVIANLLGTRLKDIPMVVSREGNIIIGGGKFLTTASSDIAKTLSKLVTDVPTKQIDWLNTITQGQYDDLVSSGQQAVAVMGDGAIKNILGGGTAPTELAMYQGLYAVLVDKGVSPIQATSIVNETLTTGVVSAVKLANSLGLSDSVVSLIATNGLIINTYSVAIIQNLEARGLTQIQIDAVLPVLINPTVDKVGVALSTLTPVALDTVILTVDDPTLAKALSKLDVMTLLGVLQNRGIRNEAVEKIVNDLDDNDLTDLIPRLNAITLPAVLAALDTNTLVDVLGALDTIQISSMVTKLGVPTITGLVQVLSTVQDQSTLTELLSVLSIEQIEAVKKRVPLLLRKKIQRLQSQLVESSKHPARFRVVLDGVPSTVEAGSFVEALSKASRGRGRRVTVTRVG